MSQVRLVSTSDPVVSRPPSRQLDTLIRDSQKITSYLSTFRNSLARSISLLWNALPPSRWLLTYDPGSAHHIRRFSSSVRSASTGDVTRLYARLWTSTSDRQPPELWTDALERLKGLALDVYSQRGSQDFTEILSIYRESGSWIVRSPWSEIRGQVRFAYPRTSLAPPRSSKLFASRKKGKGALPWGQNSTFSLEMPRR